MNTSAFPYIYILSDSFSFPEADFTSAAAESR